MPCFLRLAGADQPRRARHGGIERLVGEEQQRRLDDGEHEREEGQRHQGELDHGRAALVVAEAREPARVPRVGRMRSFLRRVMP